MAIGLPVELAGALYAEALADPKLNALQPR
jgi:hypothetical protein